MKLINVNAKAILPIMACMSLTNCTNQQAQVVKNLTYSVDDQNNINLGIEFNSGVQISNEITIPVSVQGNTYGSISLSPFTSSGPGLSLSARIDLALLASQILQGVVKTRSLPNNQPMSNYVQTDVLQLTLDDQPAVEPYIYVGTNQNQMYLGTAIGIKAIDARFPAGLVITQLLSDNQQHNLGVISVYGPLVQNNQLIHPGGIFVMTNVTDLVNLIKQATTKNDEQSLSIYSYEESAVLKAGPTYSNKPELLNNSKQSQDLWNLFRSQMSTVGKDQ